MVEEDIRDAGQDFEIRGSAGTSRGRGIKSSNDPTVLFLPEAQVRVGDWIVDELGAEYVVEDVNPLSDEGQPVALKVRYKTKAQHEADQQASRPSSINTWYIEHAPGGNFNAGVQGNIDMRITYDFRTIEGLIDRHASPDKAPAFREALEEIKGQIERDGAIKGGSLARFNDLMNDAGWFTGPLAGLVMQFLTGGSA